MNIRLKYFGMVSESTGVNEENIKVDQETPFTTSKLNVLLKNKYPKLKELNFKFAVNQNMATESHTLQENDEVALLPPFAGG